MKKICNVTGAQLYKLYSTDKGQINDKSKWTLILNNWLFKPNPACMSIYTIDKKHFW